MQPFNHAIKLWANDVNLKIRDDIVKALRNIPKRLIKKRNDKLMDYEASRTKEKGSGVRRFGEFKNFRKMAEIVSEKRFRGDSEGL